ncbi:unnamed protein product [Caenorhabditis nigoni]
MPQDQSFLLLEGTKLEMRDDDRFSFDPVSPSRIAYKHTLIKATAEKKAMWQKDRQDAFDRFENAGETIKMIIWRWNGMEAFQQEARDRRQRARTRI